MKALTRRAALCAMALLTACSAEQKPAFKGIDITGAEYARQLNLPDASGKLRTRAECPDVH